MNIFKVAFALCFAFMCQQSLFADTVIKLRGDNLRYDPIFFDASDYTFMFGKNDLGESYKISGALSDAHFVPILNVKGDLLDGAAKIYEFKADSMSNKIMVIVNAANYAEVSLIRPDGSLVNSSQCFKLSSAVLCEFEKPQIGKWRIKLKGEGLCVVYVGGISPLSFIDFGFVELGGRAGHTGFFKIKGAPIAGKTYAVQAVLSNVMPDIRVEFYSKERKILSSFNMENVDNRLDRMVFFRSNVMVPSEEFFVHAFGKDKNGVEFERIYPHRVFPSAFSIVADARLDLPLGSDTVYTLKVINRGKEESGF
ncbi:MAG: hypothetical protein LBH45_03545 [Campylobacteraceae bacterium]|jgi:hypothetical protein|nr:hypothetical protein [Campylobacteraceae bacterium]